MGTFVAAMATVDRSVEQVTDAIRAWAGEHGVGSAVEDPRPASPGGEVDVFPPEARWVVALWLPTAPYLAGRAGRVRALASTVAVADIYDGDFWRHVVLRDGDVVDRFYSDRRHFGGDDVLGPEWAGRPAVDSGWEARLPCERSDF